MISPISLLVGANWFKAKICDASKFCYGCWWSVVSKVTSVVHPPWGEKVDGATEQVVYCVGKTTREYIF